MVGGVSGGGNENKDVKSSQMSLDESTRDEQIPNSQTENCVNYFASILLGKVQKVVDIFLTKSFQ